MMTVSQLCLIFIFSFVLGTQSLNSSTTTPGNQNLTPGDLTVTPAVNNTDLDGTPGLLDNFTSTELVTILSEADLMTEVTTLPIITAASTDTEIPTSATPSGLNCTPACGANETCSDVEGHPKCLCIEDYIRVDEKCEVKTCVNIQCGAYGNCNGNSTVFHECDCNPNFSFKEGDICIAKNCENSNVCRGPGDTCKDHHISFMCTCGENRTLNEDESDCVAKTCDNSCKSSTEQCSDVNGYNCTCIEGFSRQGDDCIKDESPTPESNLTVTTDTPLPAGTLMSTDNNLETTELTTEPSEATTFLKSTNTTKPQKTSGSTEPAKPGESSTSPSTPDKKDVTGGHNYTGALIGLFIFLVVTCFVFVAVYVVRRRKLRNNYGRLDEDTEGDSGWSAFSKNPIYRGDRDYQLL